jgi:hypothetical protein
VTRAEALLRRLTVCFVCAAVIVASIWVIGLICEQIGGMR